MMALFMVLWLTSQDEKIKEAVERAFRNPFSSVTKESTGIIPANDKSMQAVKSTTGNFDSASAVELTMLRRINQDLVKSLQSDGEDQGEAPSNSNSRPRASSSMFLTAPINPFSSPNPPPLPPMAIGSSPPSPGEISRFTTFSIELEGHTESGNAHPA